MSRAQIIVLSSAVALFALIYFGGRRTQIAQKSIEETRTKKAENASINEIVGLAKAKLSEADANELAVLESKLDEAASDTAKLEFFKQLNRKWYTLQQFGVSGFYAEEVAQVEDSDEAWSMAGYSYARCFTATENEREYNFCFDKAITAFENAASLAPDSTIYRENLAFCYTQHKDPSRTMEGIKLYQGILEQDSSNLRVLMRLGKLSVDVTKDYPKAIKRLERAVVVAPNDFEANYYLARAYMGLNNNEAAKEYFRKSLALTNDASVKNNINQFLKNL